MRHFFLKHLRLQHCGYKIVIILGIYLATALPAWGVEIIAFGDSITSGRGSNTGGYPIRLQQMLEATGKHCTIYNAGISGERTYQGVERIATVLDSIKADMILIMEGTNDIRSGHPWQTTQLNLQLMIDLAKAKGVTPILATLTPNDRFNSGVLIPGRWNPMIRDLAKQNNIPLVDHYLAVEASWPSLTNDGIHPNDDGYLYLAKSWNNAVEGMVSSTGEFTRPGPSTLQLVIAAVAVGLLLYIVFRKKVKIRFQSPLAITKIQK